MLLWLCFHLRNVFEGDWEAVVYNLNGTEVAKTAFSSVKSLDSLEIPNGQLSFKDELSGELVYNGTVIPFAFDTTFKGFLGAQGRINETHSYIANIINLAILHIDVFSYADNVFNEVIVTKYSSMESINRMHWLEDHRDIIIGVGMFIFTSIVLRVFGPLMKRLLNTN